MNEFNSLWEGIRGRDQKISACSEGISVREFYLLILSTMLNLFSSFTDDKMILQAIAVHDIFIIILSQYIIESI